jgi:hypothetical protein
MITFMAWALAWSMLSGGVVATIMVHRGTKAPPFTGDPSDSYEAPMKPSIWDWLTWALVVSAWVIIGLMVPRMVYESQYFFADLAGRPSG